MSGRISEIDRVAASCSSCRSSPRFAGLRSLGRPRGTNDSLATDQEDGKSTKMVGRQCSVARMIALRPTKKTANTQIVDVRCSSDGGNPFSFSGRGRLSCPHFLVHKEHTAAKTCIKLIGIRTFVVIVIHRDIVGTVIQGYALFVGWVGGKKPTQDGEHNGSELET